jgi:hypothetical protein
MEMSIPLHDKDLCFERPNLSKGEALDKDFAER